MGRVAGGRQEVILAIDDEKQILGLVKTILEGAGYTVHTASSPKEGIEFYEAKWRDISAVLLDFSMPEMTGDLVFESLKHINPNVRAILITTDDDSVAEKMFAKGLRGYLQKPFAFRDLL
jgi:two-component system, cell cycle sensor histidine kinase and response regulator CckA